MIWTNQDDELVCVVQHVCWLVDVRVLNTLVGGIGKVKRGAWVDEPELSKPNTESWTKGPRDRRTDQRWQALGTSMSKNTCEMVTKTVLS